MKTIECRRCSECDGATHHWILDMGDDGECGNLPGDYGCKHCPQRGVECAECGGAGCCTCVDEGVVPLLSDVDWVVRYTGDNVAGGWSGFGIAEKGSGFMVCETWPPSASPTDARRIRANAALIVAAKHLLRACEQSLEAMRSHPLYPSDADNDRLSRAQEACEAAIAMTNL